MLRKAVFHILTSLKSGRLHPAKPGDHTAIAATQERAEWVAAASVTILETMEGVTLLAVNQTGLKRAGGGGELATELATFLKEEPGVGWLHRAASGAEVPSLQDSYEKPGAHNGAKWRKVEKHRRR